MSNTELPVVRKNPVRGKKQRWHAPLTLTVVALTAALTAAAAGPASAAVRAPARTAAARPAVVSGLTATELRAMARYVQLSDGRYILDTGAALKAGASRQELATESAVVAEMNKLFDPGIAALNKDHRGVVVNAAQKVQAADDGVTMNAAAALSAAGVTATGLTLTVLQGITIQVNSTGVYISMTAAGVTEFKDALVAGGDLVKFAIVVGDIGIAIGTVIAAAVVTPTSPISPALAAAIGAAVAVIWNAFGTGVAALLDFAAQVVNVCSAADGSADFSITLAPPFLACS